MDGRCGWVREEDPDHVAYHDEEWGVPVRDDRALYGLLVLEGAQAGLSWLTVLKKREGYRRALEGFDPWLVASFGDAEIRRLLANPSLIRNRRKLESAVGNARAAVRVAEEFGSLSRYVWSFVGGVPVQNAWTETAEVPARTEVSAAMSRDMKQRGFGYVGPTTTYAFMQAAGLVNDHLTTCFRWRELGAG